MAKTKKISETPDDEILLTKNEVWNVLEFSRALAGSMYPGILTPDLLNARMKDVSFTPIAASESDLNRALSDPKNSEASLRSFIENFEIISMPLKRIFSYMASHLAFDLIYVCRNATSKDYKAPKFKKDQEILYDFLDRFDYKMFFRNVSKQLLRNEIFVACVRDDGEKIVLQELPLQYCKVTSRWDYGLLVSFDFYYFLQPGVDIDLYPPFFKKKFDELFGEQNRQRPYNPSLPVESRGDSQYVYWVDLPPDIGWAFKLDTSLITAIPYFSGLMPDLINQNVMRNLQKDLNMASASKMLFGEVPLLKDSKANVRDMLAIDPKTLGQFLNLVKASLSSAIKIGSAPLENMAAISFEGNDELYDKYLRTALASSGMDTNLIYASQVKANLVDSQLSFQSDSKIMEHQLYPQFNLFMEYHANKRTRGYKYSFAFEGNDYYLDRQQRYDRATALMDKGVFIPQMLGSSLGYKPQDFMRMLEESKAMNFVDLLTPIQSPFQTPSGAGRPPKSEGQLGDSGAQSKESGGNVARGGKS